MKYTVAILAAGIVLAAQTMTQATLIDPSNLSIESNTIGQWAGAYDAGNLIDGSGLSSYDASATHAELPNQYGWLSPQGVTAGTIVFDLGGIWAIDSIVLWNPDFEGGEWDYEVRAFDLRVSSDNITYTSLSTLPALQELAEGPDSGAASAQTFSFASINAQYVALDIENNWGGDWTSLGEVAFNATDGDPKSNVPVGGSACLMLGLAMAGLGFVRRFIDG